MDILFSHVYRFLGRYLGVKRNLPPASRTLIWMIGLYDFSFAIATVFINVFLFRRHDDWNAVLTFNVVQFTLVPLGFWLGGTLSPRFGHRTSYQVGFVFHALLFLSILLLRRSAADHTVLLGVLSGLAIGFYYLGQHALTLDLTTARTRDYFFSLYLLLSSLLKIAAPGFSGWVIASFDMGRGGASRGLAGYYLVFGFTLLVYLVLIAESFRLKVPHRTADFNIRKVLALRWEGKWKRLLASWFFYGMRGGVFWFVLNLFVFQVWHNEMAVGNYNMMSTFLAVVTAYALSRWSLPRHREWGMAVSSGLIVAAALLLAVRMGPLALLLFAVLYNVGLTWFQVGFSAISFDVIEGARESSRRRLEYLTLRELPLALGRLLGLAGFWIAQSRFGEAGIRTAVFALGLTQLGTWAFSSRRFKKRVKTFW